MSGMTIGANIDWLLFSTVSAPAGINLTATNYPTTASIQPNMTKFGWTASTAPNSALLVTGYRGTLRVNTTFGAAGSTTIPIGSIAWLPVNKATQSFGRVEFRSHSTSLGDASVSASQAFEIA